MKPIAIHNSHMGFHPRWIAYCLKNDIPHKLVDCYANDLVEQLTGCCALMWHRSHSKVEDVLVANAIFSTLEHARLPVFPDHASGWHFDDKIAQKYLLEVFGIPMVPTYVFLDREKALSWAEQSQFPKVFKLRRGAGSASVRLVRSRSEANKAIRRAFGRGFPLYDAWSRFAQELKKLLKFEVDVERLFRSTGRLLLPPAYARVLGNEKGYVYFQDFMPGAESDFRLIVIGNRVFGSERFVRKGDFRASGSGRFRYLEDGFDPSILQLALDVSRKLGSACLSMDILKDGDGKGHVLEFSFGFMDTRYEHAPGYWDGDLRWHAERLDPIGWMLDSVLQEVKAHA